jgi:tRNA dimethylallyltransferase
LIRLESSSCRAAVAEIAAPNRWVIHCGGTGLYFKAFLEGLTEAPSADPALRAELEATPLPALLEELARRDPATCERIDRKNRRRVIRALEVIRLTGKPFSALRHPWRQPGVLPPEVAGAFVLNRPAADLRQRIDQRGEDMFRRGLVAETTRLLDAGLDRNPVALQALGYRQVVEHLRGETPLAETVERVKARTRQFAKRQVTWFKRQLPFQWLMIESSESPVANRRAPRARADWPKRPLTPTLPGRETGNGGLSLHKKRAAEAARAKSRLAGFMDKPGGRYFALSVAGAL